MHSRLLFFAFIVFSICKPAHAETPQEFAQSVYSTSGVQGGLVVHLGAGDGARTAALRASNSYIVQGLDYNNENVLRAREALSKQGVYGPVSVERLDGALLPFIDNLVNLLVVEDRNGVSDDEIKRVLTPNGVALLRKDGGWEKVVKPRPAEMDDWTHYYYSAGGNAVSKDMLVAPPERLQWVGSPRWSRHHDRMSSLSAEVSAGGRLFYIMDEGSRVSILLPSKWALTARDAFNGVVLWKKPFTEWNDHLWPLKSGPTQLARRLVAKDDRVYVTLGLGTPISCLDAATGAVVREYEGTRGTEEILLVDGILIALVNPANWALSDYAPKFNTGDQKRVETEFNWDEKPRELHAIEAATGRTLWKKTDIKVAPMTLAADGGRIAFHNGDKIVCLNRTDGESLWSVPGGTRKLYEYNFGPRVMLYNDNVFYAGGDGEMKAFDGKTGQELWSAPHQKSGYRSPEDLIIAGGLVWNAPTMNGSMSGAFSGRDPVTGKVQVEFPPNVDTYWFHHRCYIAKATERFILPSRTGIEFVDFRKKDWDINHWVRGACLYGVLPANGLVYAGPHNCACYPEAKLDGMNALAPGTASPHPPIPTEARLEKGPAFGQPLQETAAHEDDWPTYRHDAERSGYTSQKLADEMGVAWETTLKGPLSAATIANGSVFVCQIEAHAVHALSMENGSSQWSYTAGGRVDSPPTYWNGRVIFGGMDGCVYCLRASDGALIWRYHAAPSARRHMAFESLESISPVHGSVLVENGTVSFVSGRSIFLDGGLHFYRLDAATGELKVDVAYTDRDPDTGEDMQSHVKTLQMPVGSNDILSSDGAFTYLRSQKIGPDGKRIDLGPVSGDAAKQGAAQKGEGSHIFAPMGFLDDTWFHRAYWVYGKHFAGGHNGYYQAGKYAPSGRLLVFDSKNVYGYGRQPQYYRWTTTMEHQLFAASREAPNAPEPSDGNGGAKKAGKNVPAEANRVEFTASQKLELHGKALTVEAWLSPEGKDGVVVSYGGSACGLMLSIEDGKPGFSVRPAKGKDVSTVAAARPLEEGWHHVAGVLSAGGAMRLFVDGQIAAESKGAVLAIKPVNGLQLGAAPPSLVSSYGRGAPYVGALDNFAIYTRELGADEIATNALQAKVPTKNDGAVVACSFDRGDARDETGGGMDGTVFSVDTGKGKSGAALYFRAPAKPAAGGTAPNKNGTFVQHQWTRNIPIITRALAMAGDTMFVSGPPDLIDEEYAFERLTQKDQSIFPKLAEQDAALDGKRGASLWALSSGSDKKNEIELDSPPVWDGMAIAQHRLFVVTTDGKVRCFGKPQ
jgi:outer membrane protein assembly factor BamB